MTTSASALKVAPLSLVPPVVPTHEIEFVDDVSDEGVAALLGQLRDTFNEDPAADIFVYINSQGGDLSAALSAYDRVRYLARRYGGTVTTVATGLCLSAAVVLLQAGTTRLATPHTTFMLHAPFQYTWEKDQKTIRLHELEGRVKLSDVTMDLLAGLLAQTTKVPSGDWRSRLRAGPEDFFDAQAAARFGLVDGLLLPQ